MAIFLDNFYIRWIDELPQVHVVKLCDLLLVHIELFQDGLLLSFPVLMSRIITRVSNQLTS